MSKNYQIKYSAILDDLTPAGVRSIIANMKKIADAQKKIDKDLILNKRSIYEKIALSKQGERLKEASKKQNDLERARYSQLLGRQTLMDKVHRLRKLKGDEEGLKKYIRTYTGEMTKLQNKFGGLDSWKKKSDNLAKQLVIQGRLNRAEFMLGSAIDANVRKRERAKKLLETQSQRRAEGQVALGVGATAGLYAGGRGMGYAFGQTMSLEQLSIAMRSQFGSEKGNLVMSEMKKYSLETMFKLNDTVQMLLDVKKGADNLGLKTVEQQIAFTKEIGKSLLAYAVNSEKRAEAGYQLGQIFMAGTASERQDVKVIARAGIPIYGALKAMTGKSYSELQDQYGAELPAGLIAQAMLFLGKSKETVNAMKEYEKSFTMSWQATTEQFGYTSGAFGDVVSKALKLPSILRSFTKGLGALEATLNPEKDKKGEDKPTKGQLLLGSALGAGTLGLGALSLIGLYKGLNLAASRFTGHTLGALLGLSSMKSVIKILGGFFSKFAGITSFIYLVFTDWKSIFDDLNKDGLSGLKNHLVEIVSMLSVLGAGWIAGGPAGLLIAAAGITGLAAYKYLTTDNDLKGKPTSFLDAQRAEAGWKKSEQWKKPDGVMSASWGELFGMMSSDDVKPLVPVQQSPVINLDMLVNVDKGGNVSTKGKVRDPYSNPIWGGQWAQ